MRGREVGWVGMVCVIDQVFRALDQRRWFDPSTLKSMEACSRLIHVMLAEALAAGECGSWADSLRTPAFKGISSRSAPQGA